MSTTDDPRPSLPFRFHHTEADLVAHGRAVQEWEQRDRARQQAERVTITAEAKAKALTAENARLRSLVQRMREQERNQQ